MLKGAGKVDFTDPRYAVPEWPHAQARRVLDETAEAAAQEAFNRDVHERNVRDALAEKENADKEAARLEREWTAIQGIVMMIPEHLLKKQAEKKKRATKVPSLRPSRSRVCCGACATLTHSHSLLRGPERNIGHRPTTGCARIPLAYKAHRLAA